MRSLAAAVLILLASATGGADDGATEAPEAPRIGLVLSGGGALGLAHVGVLKKLEEYRVPVHAIAATSMGAIIGGLYASGYTADEIERLVVEADWDGLLEDRPPRREIPYRRKMDDFRYLTRIELGFNDGRFEAPRGLISGQRFGFELQRLLIHTAAVGRFDELPIAFRAVAADIETGEMVVLADGSVARAIRASMSVPGVFSPVEVDGRLLVDGGVVRNLPVDVVRAMGVDVVLAVDISAPLDLRDQLNSLVEVTGQMVSMVIRTNVEAQGFRSDVLIKPDVSDFRGSDFDRAAEMIPRGEAAAASLEPVLRGYGIEDAAYRRWAGATFGRSPTPPATIGSIQLSLGSTADPDFVLDRIRSRPGDPFDLDRIADDLERLYATGDYELVDIFVTTAPDGTASLHVDAHDKSWGPNYVRFGLLMNADLEGDSSFDVLANYTMTRLNRWRGEAKFAAQLGEEPRFAAELYQPLGTDGPFLVAPWIEQSTSTDERFVDPETFASFRTDILRGGLDVGVSLGRFGEVRTGITRGRGESEPRRGPPGLSDVSVDWGGWRVSAAVDQVDNPRFPRRGYSLGLDHFSSKRSLGADRDYERLELFALGAASFGRHTVAAFTELGSALGSELPFYDQFEAGGLFRLSGLPFRSVSGRYGGTVTGLYFVEIARLTPGLGGGVFAGGSVETGSYWLDRAAVSAGELTWAGSLFIGADTLLGPVYLGYGRADTGDDAFYLFVGTWLD